MYIKGISMENYTKISQLLADYAAVSGRLASFIGDRAPSDEEQRMMDRLLEIHVDLVVRAVRQSC